MILTEEAREFRRLREKLCRCPHLVNLLVAKARWDQAMAEIKEADELLASIQNRGAAGAALEARRDRAYAVADRWNEVAIRAPYETRVCGERARCLVCGLFADLVWGAGMDPVEAARVVGAMDLESGGR